MIYGQKNIKFYTLCLCGCVYFVLMCYLMMLSVAENRQNNEYGVMVE